MNYADPGERPDYPEQPERLASSISKPRLGSVLFEVSEILLEQDQWRSLTMESGDSWSPPVRFRFEKHENDEGWDLVMKREPE